MKEILSQIINWNKKIKTLSLLDSLNFILNNIKGKKAFSTSFGVEDQIITHVLNQINKDIFIFTLDTGRLFYEVYDTLSQNQKKYKNIKINTLFPLEHDINNYILKNGINGFYNSIEQRKECCRIRKILPLARALSNVKLWITGIRKEQSEYRSKMNFLEYNISYNLIKFNPLLEWTDNQINDYIKDYNIPVISLYNKGFKSIGCYPCTRAIKNNENSRNGRWWWEKSINKECGLHY